MKKKNSLNEREQVRFGLGRQAVGLATVLGIILAAGTAIGYFLQSQIVATARETLDVNLAQSVSANQIAAHAESCFRLDVEYELRFRQPTSRAAIVSEWKTAYEKLNGQVESLQSIDLSELDRRRVDQWAANCELHGRRFLSIVDRVEAGELTAAKDWRKARTACLSSIRKLPDDAHALANAAAIAAESGKTRLLETVRSQNRLFAAAVLFGLVAILLPASWIARSVARRARVLTEAVGRLLAGDLDVRVGCASRDEFGLLADRFNQIAAMLQRSQEQQDKTRGETGGDSRDKSRFVAEMAEELHASASLILTKAEMLSEHITDSDGLAVVGTVKRSGEHLVELVEDARDLSKLELGELEIRPVPYSLPRIIAAVASQTRVRAEAKGLSLDVEYDGPIPETIRTDANRVTKVLVNLVNTAVRLTEIGKVRLVARFLDNDDKPMLQIDVTDTSAGMTDEQIERLFEPFGREKSEDEPMTSSMGLGLLLCRRLVARLGGSLQIVSAPGSGSKFTVTIPVGSVADVARIENASEAAHTQERQLKKESTPRGTLDGKILLAEDGPENQRLISFLLRKAGAEVTVVDDGQLAVEAVLGSDPAADSTERSVVNPFDLILMDMQMPVLDGYDAVRNLRSNGYTGTIVAITGHTMSYDRQKCLDAGCNDYLAKPVTRQSLIGMAARHLTHPAADASPSA